MQQNTFSYSCDRLRNRLASALALLVLGLAPRFAPGAEAPGWPALTLLAPREVTLGGSLGTALQRGVARLALPPYTADWLLADVSFEVNRIFTNYSGDVSGRFIELAALTCPPGSLAPATLAPVLADVAKYQRADGHFGVEIDLQQPLKKMSPPIPMLWGNARLLAGLVTAARELNRPDLLAAARKLGDFYIDSSVELCSPAREAELRATGTGGDGYACCYFPAIESLALLYRATRDERYLTQARRMAEVFEKFDALPTDHSHGNLCAWRGILELHQLTGEPSYLERARAKWAAAVQGGYVWPVGGIGEHWYVFHPGDEGCSESDWLRFNLELWRFTGETRYLDLAERLLHNQYAANQCANGGYGWRSFEGDAAGPIGTRGAVEEWNFCCSFHGPLGLHFLKAYLAAGSRRGIYVNFPIDFSTTVGAAGRTWRLAVNNRPVPARDRVDTEIELAPAGSAGPVRTTLWLRRPEWASEVTLSLPSGAALPAALERGYLRVEREFKAGEKIRASFAKPLRVEARRFQSLSPQPGTVSRWRDVTLLAGPEALLATPAPRGRRMVLLAQVDAAGRLQFPGHSSGGEATVALPSLETSPEQAAAALESASPVVLQPWRQVQTRRNAAFACDLVVLPAKALPNAALARFAERAARFELTSPGPAYGENLERRSELWDGADGWQFVSNAIHVTTGDIGLLAGEGYTDYRFEFDLELPAKGQGIAGWVVRAQSTADCLMFQLQSADSPFKAPQFKTQPNTLRPHVRHNGEWTIADPVPLPKPVRQGETHRIGVECRGAEITVFLDGEKVCRRDDAGFHGGSVGFRAAGPAEQGLFRNIALRKL